MQREDWISKELAPQNATSSNFCSVCWQSRNCHFSCTRMSLWSAFSIGDGSIECSDYWKQTGPKWGTWLWQDFCAKATAWKSFPRPALPPSFVHFRPFTQCRKWMCLQCTSYSLWKPATFGIVKELAFWHSVNGKYMLAHWKCGDVDCAFSLWLTTANENFPASCLFTTLLILWYYFHVRDFMCVSTTVRLMCGAGNERNKRQRRAPQPCIETFAAVEFRD